MSIRTRTPRRLAGLLAAVLAAALLLVPGLSGGAAAIPPGGAGPDTPGTASNITTKKVPVGGTVKFTVSGFPGGETLYIKIDDEAYCTSPPFGACVYHQQKIPASGSVSGSMTLPPGLGAGSHTLRFLASQTAMENGQEVLKGFTRKSPAFTVEAAAAAKPDQGGAAAPAAPAPDGGAPAAPAPSEQAAPGPLVAAAPSAAAPAGHDAAVPEPVVVAQPTPAATTTTATTDDDLVPMPWIGLYVLLGCLLVSSLMTTIAVFTRR